jgi:hypothetical protein
VKPRFHAENALAAYPCPPETRVEQAIDTGTRRITRAQRAQAERRRRWLVIAAVGALICLAFYAVLSRIWSPAQGAWGVFALGGVAVALMLAATTYTLRKRVRIFASVRLDEWLLAHNYLAALALFVAALHALLTYQGDWLTWLGALWNDITYPDDPNTSLSGTVSSWTFAIMAVTVLTGLLGRVLQSVLPRQRLVQTVRLVVHVALAATVFGMVVGHVALVLQEDAEANAAVADLQPTLPSLENELFKSSCAQRSCHSSFSEKGGLVLEPGKAYENLVNVQADNKVAKAAGKVRVVPGDPDASFLIQKLTRPGPGEGDLMPKRSHALPPQAVEIIREWIKAGAPPK